MMDFDNYVSPFSWRYATAEMKKIWSEGYKYALWRRIWVTLAEVQSEVGLISQEELADLKKHELHIDVERIVAIEEETRHDVVAAIAEFAEKAKIGGRKIHFGATSMDIVDNADALRIQEALVLTETNLKKVLQEFKKQIKKYAAMPCIGYTHLQPAEPTTVGYRLAFYAQDLLLDLEYLEFVKSHFFAKGFKGAVGTRASYKEILKNTKLTPEQLDAKVCQKLGITPALITTQVYPRKYDYFVLSLVAAIAASVSKFCADVRILQSPAIGEWSEPFSAKQVGSSAMPFKRNPVNCEKVCSLARFIAQLPPVALENAALSYLERTLDDSANKRIIIAEGFLALDEILKNVQKIVSGLIINKQKISQNLAQYGPFAATEPLMIELVKKGADRQEMHEVLRGISMIAWKEVQNDRQNPLKDLLLKDKIITKFLSPSAVTDVFAIENHVGDATQRAEMISGKI